MSFPRPRRLRLPDSRRRCRRRSASLPTTRLVPRARRLRPTPQLRAARGEAQLRREPWAMRASRSWTRLLVSVPLSRSETLTTVALIVRYVLAVRRGLVGETWFPPRVTERAGFEPATHLSARTRFPVALLRPLGHLSVLRSGEGGIRTLDGGIHPHNALAGRRLQPLGHFSAGPRRIADCLLKTDARAKPAYPLRGAAESAPQRAPPSATRPLLRGPRRIADPFADPPSGGGKHPPQHENELAGSPLIPRQSETRLRLPEAGFAFQGDYDTVIVSFIPAASWPGMVQ